MTAPRITVMRDRYVRSWPDKPGKGEGERAYALTAAEALLRPYKTDAHCTQYTSDKGRRLSREAVDAGAVAEISFIMFDVDCQEVHGTPEPAPDAWRAEMRAKMHALWNKHPGAFYFETRGGARIVYRQPKTLRIASRADEAVWSQRYAVSASYLSRRFGIEADPACGDWTRLFRLPRATRKPGGDPEQWEIVGDPSDIGVIDVPAKPEDLESAMERSKAFKEKQTLHLVPSTTNGVGLLYYALVARGHVLRERSGMTYLIRCPREAEHTSGRTGDSSTLLYPPAMGERIGAIHCLHAHCAALDVKGWLRCFSKEELAAASKAAGFEQ